MKKPIYTGHTLLAVLAHPDDESFGMGGTLAHYARLGAAVHLVCATRGEAGTLDPDCLEGYASVAERRTAELACAAEKLGLSGVNFLDYRDSGMPGAPDNQHPKALINAPQSEVAARVASYIRALRPQVVVTFDPIGGYKHPDHIAIHQATVEAYRLGGDPTFVTELPPHRPSKLYYHIIPKGYLKLAVRLLPLFGRDPRKLGRNGDMDLLSLIQDGNFPTHAHIKPNEQILAQADAAVLCHASQLEGRSLRSGVLRWTRALFGSGDHFMRAEPPAPPGLRERDLFAGL